MLSDPWSGPQDCWLWKVPHPDTRRLQPAREKAQKNAHIGREQFLELQGLKFSFHFLLILTLRLPSQSWLVWSLYQVIQILIEHQCSSQGAGRAIFEYFPALRNSIESRSQTTFFC